MIVHTASVACNTDETSRVWFRNPIFSRNSGLGHERSPLSSKILETAQCVNPSRRRARLAAKSVVAHQLLEDCYLYRETYMKFLEAQKH